MNDITFDNFYSLDSKIRKQIINDPNKIKELLKKNLKKERYEHSISVAETARILASKHHVDVKKAYMAGLLHDCAKYLSETELDLYLLHYDKDKLNMPIGVKHSFVGKFYLKEKLNYHDKDILNAIYNHTICYSKDKLSLIIYIADKREPLRNINDEILNIAFKDLYKAYELLKNDVEEYVKGKDGRFIENSL